MSNGNDALRATSDALLRDLDVLAGLELEKRALGVDAPESHELATRIEELAARVLQITAHQRALTAAARIAPPAPRAAALILAEWREAERRAGAAPEGSLEAEAARADADRLREEYRAAFDVRRGQDRDQEAR